MLEAAYLTSPAAPMDVDQEIEVGLFGASLNICASTICSTHVFVGVTLLVRHIDQLPRCLWFNEQKYVMGIHACHGPCARCPRCEGDTESQLLNRRTLHSDKDEAEKHSIGVV